MFTNFVELWNEEDSDGDCKYLLFEEQKWQWERERKRRVMSISEMRKGTNVKCSRLLTPLITSLIDKLATLWQVSEINATYCMFSL